MYLDSLTLPESLKSIMYRLIEMKKIREYKIEILIDRKELSFLPTLNIHSQ